MGVAVAVLGASGRMGRLVIAEILEDPALHLVAAVTRPGSPALGSPAGPLAFTAVGPGAFAGAEVVIDFSLPDGLDAALPHLAGAALVSGTTGLSAAQEARLAARSERAPVLRAANFSTGVNLLLDLVRRASAALPDYDIEIVETHHRHKRDAPSGTALALGEAAASGRDTTLDAVAVHGRSGATGTRPRGEIALHALRGGDVVGEHTVWLAGEGERVALQHIASSRATFARGAVRAAKWIAGRPAGHYDMDDVLQLR